MIKNKIPTTEKIAIGLPRGVDTRYHYETVRSLIEMFSTSPCQYQMISVSKVHHVARNEIIKDFLDSDKQYLLFIDSDMIWEKDSLPLAYDLIQREDVDIVTAIYHQKNKPYLPTIKKLDLKAGCYNSFISWGGKPFEVDGSGMGFCLIARHVLEAMKPPHCDWVGGFSEDLYFFLKAKKDHGFKIWAHPRIRVSHIAETTITTADWESQFKPGVKAWIRENMRYSSNYLRKLYPNWRESLGIHPLQFKNINTDKYWDNIYEKEGGANKNWRKYPEKFDFIVKDLLKGMKPKADILELGCGVGVFAKLLKSNYPDISYYGIDISQTAIDELKKLGLDGVAKSMPPILELEQGVKKPLDLIIGLEFLEHLDDEPRLGVVREASEMIGGSGRAIFSVPDDCMPPEDVPEHRVKFNKESFEEFLSKAFDNVKVHQIASRPSTLSEGKFNFLVADCNNNKKGVKK